MPDQVKKKPKLERLPDHYVPNQYAWTFLHAVGIERDDLLIAKRGCPSSGSTTDWIYLYRGTTKVWDCNINFFEAHFSRTKKGRS